MRGGIIEINWHDSQPVLSLDFHPKSGLLATGGTDHDIKLWVITSCGTQDKLPRASYKSNLSYHTSSVNTLRFSPSGQQLASGADGGELVIWTLHASEDGDSWKFLKRFSSHQKDVLDLQWSTDGLFLISGSVDNSCIIWDVNRDLQWSTDGLFLISGSVDNSCIIWDVNRGSHQVLDSHLHYVQGVAWDPQDQYVASLSSDRTCRIYARRTQNKLKGPQKINFVCQHTISKSEPQKLDDNKATTARTHLFHDETLPSFFRRLAWSPDGSFLVIPAGTYRVSPASETVNTAYVFSRQNFSRPAVQLPGANKPIIAVRFCPIVFGLQGSNSTGLFKLPYRIIFAVATLNSIYIYDTESSLPIAVFAGLHYAAITDIAWAADAKYLAVSSRDCYCTLVEFEDGEFGVPVSLSESQKPIEKADIPTLEAEVGSSMDVDNVEAPANDPTESVKPNADKLEPTVREHTKTDRPAKKRITPIVIE